ncbi:uncharacterized protein LOC131875937 [Cryptomeria japonica]|uniref:uncharacterized protein LOC131875937 n=1 Tax=Cryptomeria japonica TaxID=3369 RepID=UPI0027DA153D|nr:uncharacterized protein LOC131875937 [Cryptomeria japonica]
MAAAATSATARDTSGIAGATSVVGATGAHNIVAFGTTAGADSAAGATAGADSAAAATVGAKGTAGSRAPLRGGGGGDDDGDGGDDRDGYGGDGGDHGAGYDDGGEDDGGDGQEVAVVGVGTLGANSSRSARDVYTDWMTWVVTRRRSGLGDQGHQVLEQEVPQVEKT